MRGELRSYVCQGLAAGGGLRVSVVDETGDVKKGDTTVGTQRQYSGTSGNSSGPHLHFEVHTGEDTSNAGAIDPVPWMQQQGITFD